MMLDKHRFAVKSVHDLAHFKLERFSKQCSPDLVEQTLVSTVLGGDSRNCSGQLVAAFQTRVFPKLAAKNIPD